MDTASSSPEAQDRKARFFAALAGRNLWNDMDPSDLAILNPGDSFEHTAAGCLDGPELIAAERTYGRTLELIDEAYLGAVDAGVLTETDLLQALLEREIVTIYAGEQFAYDVASGTRILPPGYHPN
jgi:hypothetical protein